MRQPRRGAARQRGVRTLLLPLVALVSLLTGCGGTATAEWRLAPDQDLGPDTRVIDVLVTRTGCNGGVTGEPQEPEVGYEPDRVVITFEVSPGRPDAATCPSNDAVPATVVLDAPLGDRALVDGETGRERTPRAD